MRRIPRATRGGCGRVKRLVVVTLLVLLSGAVSSRWSEEPATVSAAAMPRHKVYCSRHHHPHGCIAVPKSAKRPSRVSQQGSDALTPLDVENGGGLGGGPGNHRYTALAWARTQRNLKRWAWRCERFVEEAYGTRSKFPTAAAAASSVELHRGPITSAPRGSLVYFAADKYNQRYGHVGLSVGGGSMISALTHVAITDVARSRYWRDLYLGWADAPATWPGRIPPPPGPTTTDPGSTVRFTAPAFGQTVSGTVPLLATVTGAGGVVFDAYYATDPRDAATRGWHPLGGATRQGDIWTFEWNTASVPDQGYGPWGTVNVAATALDASGARTGTRDYRRVSIDNTTGSTPPPTTGPPVPTPTGTPTTTYPETTGGATNTWTNYTNAGGNQGPTIPSNTTVQITCKLQGFPVADGNTWWYRIASDPWNNVYHSSADAFYNNGQTAGSLHGTPLVDPGVPTCP
jgi:NlpC/P60 family